MGDNAVQLLESNAPTDVRAAINWLLHNGYVLASSHGDSTFGAEFVYVGTSEVRVVVDRSQWMLDIAASPGAPRVQYDLAVAARSGSDYGESFPDTGKRSPSDPLPEQLPEGVSWRETLPGLLDWVRGLDVGQAIERAQRQRAALMWSTPGDR